SVDSLCFVSTLRLFFFSSRRRHTSSVSAFLLNRSSDLKFNLTIPLQERVLIRHHDYDQCFQSVQLLQWNSQVKFNVTVYRNLPDRKSVVKIGRASCRERV